MKKLRHTILMIFSALVSLILIGCGDEEFQKSPLDEIIRDIPRDDMFTIILYDMDVEGDFLQRYS